MTAGRMWGRLGLLLLVALICGGGVSAATASPLGHVGPAARAGHPPPPDPTAAARYLAAQRAGYGSPAHAARVAAKAALQAQTIRARPIPQVAGAASLSAAWTALGPSPVTSSFYGSQNTGRVDSVAVVPSGLNRGEIFIGTAGGGVWSSTDNGVTWQTHTDHVSTGLAIGALAIDPSNPTTIYAGTGEANNCGDCFYGGGVLKSTDSGQTWTVQNPGGIFTGLDFSSIAVDPRDGQHLYATVTSPTTGGLYVSTDGGASWAHPAGDTSTQPAYGLALDPATNPTTVFVATQGTGVQKSTNAGASFTTLAGGLPAAANFGNTMLGIGTPSTAHPNANQTLYATVQLNGTTDASNGGDLSMYKTTNGGTSWTRQTTTPAYTNQSYAYGSGTADQAWYDNAIAVDPANPSHVIAAGIAVVESTDGGATWSNVNGQSYFAGGTNVVHPDFHALTFASASEAIFGCDGGVYAYNPTTPGPAGVTSLNTNQNTTQLYEDISVYNNGAQVLGGLQDNGTALYSGAAAWPSVNSGDGGYNAINPLDPAQQFSEADQGLYETTNSWGTSTKITPPFEPRANTNFVPPMVIVPNSAAVHSPTVFYGGEDLYVTHNPTAASPSWTRLTSVGSGVSAIAVAPSNPAVMYVGFDNGTLEVSTNATAATPTFTAISPAGVGQWITHIDVSPSNPGSIAVSFSNSNTHYSSVAPMVETGAVTLTGSPAATYTNITGNLPTGVASNSVVFDSGLLAVATDVGVFSTSSPSGPSTVWTAVGTGLPNVQVIGLTVAGNGDLYAATHGRGVWKLNVSGSTPPTVSGISPTSGPAAGATSVTITGTNLAGASAVNFGPNPATFTVNSATSITATSPAGSGTVDVTVTTPAGTSATSSADQFAYATPPPPPPAPTVTAISPTSGGSSGGTSVTITGTNLAGASAVNFGLNAAPAFTVNSATSITATSPAGSGTVDVTVTTPAGTSAAGAGDRFTYLLSEPGTPMAQITGSGAFGTQLVGTTSASHDLTVTNNGSAALSVPPGGATLSGADAGQYVLTGDSCSGRQIAPSSACTVQVAFAPSTPGIHAAASVLVSDNAAGSPQSVALSGTAIQASPGPTAPAISHLQQSHRRWRLGSALPKLISRAPGKTLRGRAPRGTVFTFVLPVGARVTLSFAQRLPHRRTRARGSFSLSGHAGIDRIAFAGRLSRRQKLAPGTYTVTFVATNSAGHSKAVQLVFTIAR